MVKKRYVYLVLSVFLILCAILLCDKNTDNKTLDKVKLSDKNSSVSKDLLAIMISDEDGNYSESTNNAFPSDGYIFNQELSSCIDINGKVVNDILTYDTTNNLVTVSTDTTVYCYLYFDIIVDTEPPTNNSLLINNGDSYTTSTNVTLTLSSNGAKEMCISNTTSCSNWEPYATSKSHTLTTGDGTKTVYVWFRDEYENTSEYVTNTINLDTVAYVCTPNTALGTCLQFAKTNGFNSSLEGGLYRYQGASGYVNNYVCFGTSDKSSCIENANAYMYRIIGADSNGQVKLIKNSQLRTLMWSYSNITWPNSTIHYWINESYFYTNTTYVPTNWQDKIATHSWKYGDISSADKTATEIYNIENSWGSIINAKIGLMYIHDFTFSPVSGGLNCTFSRGNEESCTTSWMHISNCDSNAKYKSEWTMSRYAYISSSDIQYVWYIGANPATIFYSCSGGTNCSADNVIRPVFYLTNSVTYVSGSGTSDDPFLIS